VDEFEQLAGIGWKEFCGYVNAGIKEKHVDPSAPPFARAVVHTALDNNLLRGDLAQQDFTRDPKNDSLPHWGKTPDGRVVLLDYGFTGEVWRSHYSSSSSPAQTRTAGAPVDANAKTQRAGRGDTSRVSGTARTQPAHRASDERTTQPQQPPKPRPSTNDEKTRR